MNRELTVASFFSGVGGVDLGLGRAGWRTVSVSEIDPYACAILARHWPDAPNLGDIVALAERETSLEPRPLQPDGDGGRDAPVEDGDRGRGADRSDAWKRATLWTAGFPCQDLSTAGKRAGFGGHRSVLAFVFLDLVQLYRPPWLLLENVPGLFSSHRGADFSRLLDEISQLGYGVAWRVIDARHYVPQRRRRVFILATADPGGRDGAERAATVLHHAAGGGGDCRACRAAREASAGTSGDGYDDAVGALPAGVHGFPDGVQEYFQGHFRVVGAPTDALGVREADGLGRRPHDRPGLAATDLTGSEVAATLRGFGHGWQGQHHSTHTVFVKARNARDDEDYETWEQSDVSRTLNTFENQNDQRATVVIAQPAFLIEPETGQGADLKARATDISPALTANALERSTDRGVRVMAPAPSDGDDDLLPLGLDSARYRVIGNGVVAPVAEAIGRALASELSAVEQTA